MSTSDAAQLIPKTQAPGLPPSFPLKGDQTTLGRHPSNDIVLALDSISRFHARIDCRGDFFIIQDLNSSNGCFVNGERVTQQAIHHGDMVTFGNVEFEFKNVSHATLPTTSSASHVSGMDIIDIRDDRDTAKPTTQSYIKVEDAAGQKKSSVISSVDDKKADKAAIIRLNQRLAALYKLSEMLREIDADKEATTLQKVLELIFQVVAVDRGLILTRFHEESEQFDVGAVKYRDDPIVPQKVRVSRTILEQVLRERVSILSRDAQSDERFAASESIIAAKVQSAICSPMIIGGKVLGVLVVETNQSNRILNQDDLEFVTIVASETGVALANVRMQRDAIHRQRLAAVGETVAGISHSMKNNLLLAQGGSEILSRALEKGDMNGAREAWSIVSRGIDRIKKLAQDMLEYSSNKKPDLTEININDLIEQIAEEIENQLVAKSVVLELMLDDNIAPRLLDARGLEKTLMNLIVNSVEAITHTQGEVVVTTGERADGTLVITVKDNGCGIPEDRLSKVFLPFYTTKGNVGTGLGLPTCKKCIEDMGGTMRVESQENIGTKFTMEIPPISAE